jgi:hypothetical protein
LLVVFAANQLGCAAAVTLKDGRTIDGRILRSDASTIYIKPRGSAAELAISREEISDINHPGDVVGLIGTAPLLTALILLSMALATRDNCNPNGEYCGFEEAMIAIWAGIPLASIGLGLELGGWIPYGISKSAASSHASSPAPLPAMDKQPPSHPVDQTPAPAPATPSSVPRILRF